MQGSHSEHGGVVQDDGGFGGGEDTGSPASKISSAATKSSESSGISGMEKGRSRSDLGSLEGGA